MILTIWPYPLSLQGGSQPCLALVRRLVGLQLRRLRAFHRAPGISYEQRLPRQRSHLKASAGLVAIGARLSYMCILRAA
jgi:hypothetical protein